MLFEPWMLAAMEEAGYTDTREGCLNRLARCLNAQPEDCVGNEMFLRACADCGVDPASLDGSDLEELQRKLDRL